MQPDVADPVATDLQRRNPGKRILRFLSDGRSPAARRPIKNLELQVGGSRLFASLPNPSPRAAPCCRRPDPEPDQPATVFYETLTSGDELNSHLANSIRQPHLKVQEPWPRTRLLRRLCGGNLHLPPSVAEVATAVPAFIGYTEAGRKLARVTSMLEFEATFGKAKPTAFIASTVRNAATGHDELQDIRPQTTLRTPIFCSTTRSAITSERRRSLYIVSVGDYARRPQADFIDGLALIAKEDEPTLIVLTDAVLLKSADYMEVAQEALAQCDLLKDRFVILDVPGGDVDGFRNGIGTSNLSYAAAYHPYVETSLTFAMRRPAYRCSRAPSAAKAFYRPPRASGSLSPGLPKTTPP